MPQKKHYDEDCHAAFIAQQIARIFERLPTAYLFTGDITHGQPYLHRDDLVDAVVRAVDRRAELPDETILLIGEEETPSYQELQERIGDLIHGEHWRTLSLPKGVAKLGSWVQIEVLDQETHIKPWMVENSDDHYELDISRARELLGWAPRHTDGHAAGNNRAAERGPHGLVCEEQARSVGCCRLRT